MQRKIKGFRLSHLRRQPARWSNPSEALFRGVFYSTKSQYCLVGWGRRTTDPMSTNGQAKVLTHDEIAQLFAAMDSPRDRALFGIMLYCGLRVSEAIALRSATSRGCAGATGEGDEGQAGHPTD
jgi:integrase